MGSTRNSTKLDRLPQAIPTVSKKDLKFKLSAIKNLKVIDSGNFSSVSRGKYKGKDVAVKIVNIVDEKYALLEISILKGCNHENILNIIGAGSSEATVEGSGLRKRRYHIVMPFMKGGTLKDALKIDRKASLDKTKVPKLSFTWKMRLRVASQIAKSLAYLHSLKLVHRDVKSENVLLTSRKENLVAKLADFGFSRGMQQISQTGNPRLSVESYPEKKGHVRVMTICGTEAVMAPEMMLNLPYSFEVDMFSFGCLLIELLCGRGPGEKGFLQRVAQTHFEVDVAAMKESVIPGAPHSMVELAAQCVSYETDERPSPQEASEWLEELEEEWRLGKLRKVVRAKPSAKSPKVDGEDSAGDLKKSDAIEEKNTRRHRTHKKGKESQLVPKGDRLEPNSSKLDSDSPCCNLM